MAVDHRVVHRDLLDSFHTLVLNTLKTAIKSRDHPALSKLSELTSSDDIAKLVSSHGWWTPTLLSLFSDKPVSTISLSSSIGQLGNPRPYLQTFFQQGSFLHLTSLSLAGMKLSHEDISLLRLLPALGSLDLSSTCIATSHLLHLITHSPTLHDLNISSNDSINDDARIPLSAFSKLSSLHLRGTSITTSCLRLLVYALPRSCRFVTVPQETLDHLNCRSRRYCSSIPMGYVQDPRQVPNLTVVALKKNLELHRKVNSDVALGGNKVDMVERLMSILCSRVADGLIIKRVGKL
ncbi:MAG: hypothetical protein M1837_005574 [Sclerophora amabilis]|nr:MAG: hypothetical protein M1837_005574 [Sclerophora amabilis]